MDFGFTIPQNAECHTYFMRSFFLVFGSVLICAAGMLHIYFFKLESIDWLKPKTWKTFGLASQEHAEIMRSMAYNQGFYNLFLALGALLGTVLLSINSTVGFTLMIFSATSMVLAGLVLLMSIKNSKRAATIQVLPPLLGILLIVTGFSLN